MSQDAGAESLRIVIWDGSVLLKCELSPLPEALEQEGMAWAVGEVRGTGQLKSFGP